MKLNEFRKIINNIPKAYNNVDVCIICENKLYDIKDFDDIEYYKDDMYHNKKMIDITVRGGN